MLFTNCWQLMRMKKKNIKYKRPNMAEPETNIFLFSSLDGRTSRQCIIAFFYVITFLQDLLRAGSCFQEFKQANQINMILISLLCGLWWKVHTFNLFNSKFTFWQTIKIAHIQKFIGVRSMRWRNVDEYRWFSPFLTLLSAWLSVSINCYGVKRMRAYETQLHNNCDKTFFFAFEHMNIRLCNNLRDRRT